MAEAGFKITQGKGFHITFQNGYTVSVQFGFGSYCDNTKVLDPFKRVYPYEVEQESSDAEVAVFKGEGDLMALPEFGGDTLGAHYSPDMVLKLLNWAKRQK